MSSFTDSNILIINPTKEAKIFSFSNIEVIFLLLGLLNLSSRYAAYSCVPDF